MEEVKTKVCTKCGRRLPQTTYYFKIDRQKKDGLNSSCKDCDSKRRTHKYTYHGNRKDGMRKCSQCNEWKPATAQYFYRGSIASDGLRPVCKLCLKNNSKHTTNRRWAKQPTKENYLICTCCGKELPASNDYFIRVTKAKTGYSSRCKDCLKNDRALRRKKINEWIRQYRVSNLQANIACKIRNRIRAALRHNCKKTKSVILLGCSFEYFKSYFESLFDNKMSWDSFMAGDIHIDHIVPCSAFDLTDSEQQKLCFHYTNLQPLWSQENFSKGSLYNGKRHYCKKK